MKNKTIYLLRHGETDFNKLGKVQGRGVDASLNETGQRQASLTCDWLKQLHLEKVYTSSLKRTAETVEPLQMPYQAFEGFDEISWGSMEGVVPTAEEKDIYWHTLRKWQEGELHHRVGGGETPIEVMHRQQEAMNHVLADSAEQVLVCMHGRAMRILLSWLLNYPLHHMEGFAHQNCSIYQLSWNGRFFRLDRYNYTGHLMAI